MTIQRITTLALLLALVGCSSREKDLQRFLETTRQEQGGRVEPLPEPKPYDSFTYNAAGMRSPFVPFAGAPGGRSVKPVSNRNREFLEQFPLDQLQMGGTYTIKGKTYGIVKYKDNLSQSVLPGNYVGQSEGRVTRIEPSRITIVEIVADQMGGYMERTTALSLPE